MKEIKTNIRFRQKYQFFNTITEDVGEYSLLSSPDEDVYVPSLVFDYIDEITFYQTFLYIKSSLSKTVYTQKDGVDRTLTPVNIEYMSTIMAKDMDYTMPCNSKNHVQKDLAAELGRSPKSVYSAVNRLKRAGYLVVTEDDLIVPNAELQTLRKVTKNHLEKLGSFPVSYMLNFIVSNTVSEEVKNKKRTNKARKKRAKKSKS